MPFEDRTALNTVLEFISDYRPDYVIQLGHLLNLPPLGRFTGQATTELRRRELTHTADYVRRNYLSRLRNIYHGPLTIICSAASARLGNALHRKTARDKTTPISVERLVDLDDGDAIELSTTYILAPGWTLLYGDNIAVADSEIPGNSALRIARHLGVSVIAAHTMRLGKSTYTATSADGATHTVTGVEIGHLIDPEHTPHMNGRAGGWQHGFAIVETDGSRVCAACVPLSANRRAVRWAGRPQTGDGGPAAGHALGSAASAQPTASTRSGRSTIGHRQGLPTGRCGSRPDAGCRAGDTATQGASVGIEHRPARGVWSR